MAKQVFVFRHGQPADGGQDVCRGNKLDTPLSADGLFQTQTNIHQLKQQFNGQLRKALVITSPLDRAAHFGRYFQDLHGSRHVVDPKLNDIDVGDWEGKSWEQIEAQWNKEFHLCWEDARSLEIPGARESIAELVDRTLSRWRDWVHHSTEELLIFCLHKAPNKIILDDIQNRKLTFKGQKIGCMNEIDMSNDGILSIIQEDTVLYRMVDQFALQLTE